MKELVLKEGTRCLCIKNCIEKKDDYEETDNILYIEGNIYVSTKQGFLVDEERVNRQWKEDWFTLSKEFYIYFKILPTQT